MRSICSGLDWRGKPRHFSCRQVICLSTWLLLSPSFASGAEAKLDEWLNRAQAANLKGDRPEALRLANQAVAAAPQNPQCYYVRGRIQADSREPAKAVADFDQVLKLEPRAGEVYQLRGFEHFKLGHIAESIADFDRYLQRSPQREAHHWQRGISYYYAGRYEEGRKQFELHQTVNSNDVENAVWHFLCVARQSGVDKARAALIPIQGDQRVPMMEVHALFGGKAKPESVLEAARAGKPAPAVLDRQLFYAYLYLGLYFEAIRDAAQAQHYIYKAAELSKDNGYMGDVARVHAAILRRKQAPDGK
jgi:lipoprotein NlpI